VATVERQIVYEITPAMIEAGVQAFARFDRRFDSEDEAVRLIFLAMLNARVPAEALLDGECCPVCHYDGLWEGMSKEQRIKAVCALVKSTGNSA
jgi:hypothetical protein